MHEVVQEVRSRQGSVYQQPHEEDYDEIPEYEEPMDVAATDSRRHSADSAMVSGIQEFQQKSVQRKPSQKKVMKRTGSHHRRQSSLPCALDIFGSTSPSTKQKQLGVGSIEHLASSYPNNSKPDEVSDVQMKFAQGLYLSSSPPEDSSSGNFLHDVRPYDESFITDEYDNLPSLPKSDDELCMRKARATSISSQLSYSTSSSRDSGVIAGSRSDYYGSQVKVMITNSQSTEGTGLSLEEEWNESKEQFPLPPIDNEPNPLSENHDLFRQRSKTDPTTNSSPKNGGRPFMIPRSMSSIENLLPTRHKNLEENEKMRRLSSQSNTIHLEQDTLQACKSAASELGTDDKHENNHEQPQLPPFPPRRRAHSYSFGKTGCMTRQNALQSADTGLVPALADTLEIIIQDSEHIDLDTTVTELRRFKSSRSIVRPTAPPPKPPVRCRSTSVIHPRSRSLPEDGGWISIDEARAAYKIRKTSPIPASPASESDQQTAKHTPYMATSYCARLESQPHMASDSRRFSGQTSPTVAINIRHVPTVTGSKLSVQQTSFTNGSPQTTTPRSLPFVKLNIKKPTALFDDRKLSISSITPLSPPPVPLFTSSPSLPNPPLLINPDIFTKVTSPTTPYKPFPVQVTSPTTPSKPLPASAPPPLPTSRPVQSPISQPGSSDSPPLPMSPPPKLKAESDTTSYNDHIDYAMVIKKMNGSGRISCAIIDDINKEPMQHSMGKEQLSRKSSSGSHVYFDLDLLEVQRNDDHNNIEVSSVTDAAPEPPPRRRKNAALSPPLQALDRRHKNLHDFLGLPFDFEDPSNHPPSLPDRPKDLPSVTNVKRANDGRKSLRRVVISTLQRKKTSNQNRLSAGDSSEGSASGDELENRPRSVTKISSWPLATLREKKQKSKSKMSPLMNPKRHSREIENDLYSRSPVALRISDPTPEELLELDNSSDSSTEISDIVLKVPDASRLNREKSTPPPLLEPPPSPQFLGQDQRHSPTSSEQSDTGSTKLLSSAWSFNFPDAISQSSSVIEPHYENIAKYDSSLEPLYANMGISRSPPACGPVFTIDNPDDMFSIKTRSKTGEDLYINFNVKKMSISVQKPVDEGNYMRMSSVGSHSDSNPDVNTLMQKQCQSSDSESQQETEDYYMSMSDMNHDIYSVQRRPSDDAQSMADVDRLEHSSHAPAPAEANGTVVSPDYDGPVYINMGELKLTDSLSPDVFV